MIILLKARDTDLKSKICLEEIALPIDKSFLAALFFS